MGDVTVVKLKPTYIAAVRRRTTFKELPNLIRGYFDIVYASVNAGKILKGGLNIAVYRNISEQGVDVECGILVPSKFTNVDEIECIELPTGEAVTTAHFGSYARLGEAHDRVIQWIQNNQRNRAGINWELYGHWHNNPEQVRTDVFHLLKDAN